MKNKDLKKVCCIFLLFVIILPLFSNFVSSREGNTNNIHHTSNHTSHCVPGKTKLDSSALKGLTEDKHHCHKLTSSDKCSDYYTTHKGSNYACMLSRETSS